MNKRIVIYNNKLHYWIDTVVAKDERDEVLAILVSPTSNAVFAVEISNIKAVGNYDPEDEMRRQIDDLRNKASTLRQQNLLDKAIQKYIMED